MCKHIDKKLHLLKSTSALLTLAFTSGSLYAVTCNPADSTTVDKVTACISQTHMTKMMQDFQKISDSNPDYTFINFIKKGSKTPPGSRDSGTPGDKASVKYISDYMKSLGYTVTVQSYEVPYSADKIIPILDVTAPTLTSYIPGKDFSSAVFSGSGDITAQIQPVGAIIDAAPPTAPSASGCNAADFANFISGRVALMQRGVCPNRQKVLNAIAAGAVGVITFNYSDENTGNTLLSPDGMTVPVYAYIPYSIGINLYRQALAGPVTVHIKADVLTEIRTTYNVIADSKYGDPGSTVVLGGHYDSIFGAGMLDNASGVVSMMEIAAAMKDTPTVNRLRFGFWGGEELGLYGSDYYVSNLSSADLNKIVYNLDFDVTATKNYVFNISDPAYAIANPSGSISDASLWKSNAVKASALSVGLFKNYMDSVKMPYYFKWSAVDISGSDDDTFIIAGTPIGSLVTGQGSGKTKEDVALFGGTVGPFDVCADTPYVFCDNIDNTDPVVQTKVTKAFAAVTVGLAFDHNIKTSSGQAVYKKGTAITGWTGKHFKP
ncbi:MAG: M28 family peptidase [Proteobacteria bacterium]|nr:M28 family peptidase [Pseudomonadota bacterium]